MNNDRCICRGKAQISGEWVYGAYIYFDNVIITESGSEITVDPETVGWSTGLKDKNGKLIFEGDIIKAMCSIDNGIESYSEEITSGIKYNDELSSVTITDNIKQPFQYYFNFLYQASVIEITGNIHDNPELLNQ